jgi:uncharacterized protein YciI
MEQKLAKMAQDSLPSRKALATTKKHVNRLVTLLQSKIIHAMGQRLAKKSQDTLSFILIRAIASMLVKLLQANLWNEAIPS